MFFIDLNIFILTSDNWPKFVKKMDMIMDSHLVVMLMIWFILTPFEFILDWLSVSLSNNVGFFAETGPGSLTAGIPIIVAINCGVISVGFGNQNFPFCYRMTINYVASSFRVSNRVTSGALR